MSDDQITADAGTAAKYLKALQTSGIPNTDAITMANSYMGSVVMARTYCAPPPPQRNLPPRPTRELHLGKDPR